MLNVVMAKNQVETMLDKLMSNAFLLPTKLCCAKYSSNYSQDQVKFHCLVIFLSYMYHDQSIDESCTVVLLYTWKYRVIQT